MRSGDSAPRRPDVLIVTIDTMRADAVNRDVGMPAISGFLEQSTHFRRARTTAPITLPAHASLFTGLAPAAHGVRDNVGTLLPARRDFPTLAEEFAAAGYETAGFAAAPVLDPRTGIGAGFRHYECPAPPRSLALPGQWGDLSAEASAYRALQWLERRPQGKPFFLWLHFYDPHDPYEPFAGDARRPATRASDGEAARYLGEIRRVDAALERILAAVPPSTVVVLASDHGESLGEHGERTHGMLCFSATVDILLAVRAPTLARGGVDNAPRSICDVAPSLRAWCGLRPRRSDGARLDGSPRPAILSESLYAWRLHGWGQCFAATDGRRTLVESGSTVEWFDRAEDPGEAAPREWRGDAAHEALDRALEAYRAGPSPFALDTESVVSPYGTLRLPLAASLPRRENRSLTDPRTRLDLAARLEAARGEAVQAIRDRDLVRLRRIRNELESLALEDRTTAVPFHDLFFVCAAIGEFSGDASAHRDAVAAARAILARGYASADVLSDLFSEAIAGGDLEDFRHSLDAAALHAAKLDRNAAGRLERILVLLDLRGEHDDAARGREILRIARR